MKVIDFARRCAGISLVALRWSHDTLSTAPVAVSNSLLAWRSRARSSALRIERALAKCGWARRSAMYCAIASRAPVSRW